MDIAGTGPKSADKDGNHINTIALRADMDALPMKENNPHLEYTTTTDWAHMCGHDGHMATILGTAQVIINNRSKIPSNKTVRLLFQPAEETPGGALPMVKAGCMKGVDEVYGYHNIPQFDEGDIRVCEGPFFAKVTTVRITIQGRGGHGSTPHKVRDPIAAMCSVYTALMQIKAHDIDSRKNIVFTLTQMHSGSALNVFPDTAWAEGTIRSFDAESLDKLKGRIHTLSNQIASAYDCTAEVKLVDLYPAVVNHPE